MKDDKPRIVVATDLTDASEPALVRARDHARAVGARLVVCHIVPDAIHNNPLFPQRNEADTLQATAVLKRAGDLVDEQIARLGISPDESKIVIESGVAEEEIVRVAEEEKAALVVIGAKNRTGLERVVGHVAERVVRYAHAPVLIARDVPRTGRVLVATDFTMASEPAHAMGALLVKSVGVEVTLLHVMEAPAAASPAAVSALGSPWLPPPTSVMNELHTLGTKTLQGLASQHQFAHTMQVDGDAADAIIEQAKSMGAEMIILGSRGRTRLRRLVLGSVAEGVVRRGACSVLVAR